MSTTELLLTLVISGVISLLAGSYFVKEIAKVEALPEKPRVEVIQVPSTDCLVRPPEK